MTDGNPGVVRWSGVAAALLELLILAGGSVLIWDWFSDYYPDGRLLAGGFILVWAAGYVRSLLERFTA